MTTLYDLASSAEKLLIQRLSEHCAKLAKSGKDIRLAKGELEDDWLDIKSEVCEIITPQDPEIVKRIIAENPTEIEETMNLIEFEFGDELSSIKESDFNYIPTIKTVILTFLDQDLLLNTHNIFPKVINMTTEILSSKYQEELFNDPDYIYGLIQENKYGWPLMFAGENVIDNPEVVKLATENSKWVFDFASVRLQQMAKKSSIEEALEIDRLRYNLESSLNKSEPTKRKNKL